jgi:hypothetical protein
VEEAEGVEARGLDAGAGVTAGVGEGGAAISCGEGKPTLLLTTRMKMIGGKFGKYVLTAASTS